MQESLLIAREIPHGFTWTLSSRLGDMLTYAQEMFGERNKDFTILGIEFSENGPMIWYPKSAKNIVIQLSLGSLEYEKCALYELAHETIHLLAPSGKENANVLEEGLAVYFSWWYVEHVLKVDYRKITKDPFYLKAGILVEELLRRYPEFFLKARSVCSDIFRMDESIIRTFAPDLDPEFYSILPMSFSEFKKPVNLKNEEPSRTAGH